MTNIAISVKHLTKVYKLYQKPSDRLKEALHPLRKKYHTDHYSLNDVSFDIKKGETVGIIGKNGAGKSTLLKIITGVLTPTSGSVQVNGKIASLLELGAGFNPDYTGLENVYFQGMLMGYSREEMATKVDEILAFADIGEFIHQPVKTYSSGMFARLAFSVAINVDPDILIVDEALSVGDVRFQQKCYRKFREFQENKKTILFVTHDINVIKNYCSAVFWIGYGKIQEAGMPENVCKKYIANMIYDQHVKKNIENIEFSKINGLLTWIKIENCEYFGEKGAIITHYKINNISKSTISFSGGDEVEFCLKIKSFRNMENIIVGFTVFDKYGNSVFGSNSVVHDKKKIEFRVNGLYEINFKFIMPNLKDDVYTISPAIAEGFNNEHVQHHWIHDLISFKVISDLDESRMGWLILLKNVNIKVFEND